MIPIQIRTRQCQLIRLPILPLHLTRSMPRHAAASYGHVQLLEYLISRGGNVNITDEDGDTPLYTVESVDVAQFLVEHGANASHRNSEGISVGGSTCNHFATISNCSPSSLRSHY